MVLASTTTLKLGCTRRWLKNAEGPAWALSSSTYVHWGMDSMSMLHSLITRLVASPVTCGTERAAGWYESHNDAMYERANRPPREGVTLTWGRECAGWREQQGDAGEAVG